MRYPWIHLLGVLALCGSARTGQAQETASYTRPQASLPDPVYVLNSTVIINGLLADFTNKETQEIKKVMVYKGLSSPGAQEAAPQLLHLSPSGVIDITSAKRVRSKSFAQVGRQLGLRGPLRFAINGHLLDQQAVAALRIAPAAIGQLHILLPTAELPETRVDIWLILPAKKDPSRHAPGTIFLR